MLNFITMDKIYHLHVCSSYSILIYMFYLLCLYYT